MGSGVFGTAGAFCAEGVVLIWALRWLSDALCALADISACTGRTRSVATLIFLVALSSRALRVSVDCTLGSGAFCFVLFVCRCARMRLVRADGGRRVLFSSGTLGAGVLFDSGTLGTETGKAALDLLRSASL